MRGAGVVVLTTAALLLSPEGSLAQVRAAAPQANPIERSSVQARLWLAEVAAWEIERAPLAGSGAGNFGIVTVQAGSRVASASR